MLIDELAGGSRPAGAGRTGHRAGPGGRRRALVPRRGPGLPGAAARPTILLARLDRMLDRARRANPNPARSVVLGAVKGDHHEGGGS